MMQSPAAAPSRTCAIGVMAKAPEAGRSKTRLCPPLRPADAAMMSAAFLHDTAENIAAASRLAPIVAYAAYAPLGCEVLVKSHLHAETRLVLADGTPPMPDGVEGFGRCLLHAIDGMFAAGHTAACVLSSDCPSLPTRLLVETAQILLGGDGRAVFGACPDGGYYILGLQSSQAHLFRDIAWSTADVAEQTRARAREIGLVLTELDPWYDVDDTASLRQLLAEEGGYAAPRTRAAIARLGLRDLPQFQGAAE